MKHPRTALFLLLLASLASAGCASLTGHPDSVDAAPSSAAADQDLIEALSEELVPEERELLAEDPNGHATAGQGYVQYEEMGYGYNTWYDGYGNHFTEHWYYYFGAAAVTTPFLFF